MPYTIQMRRRSPLLRGVGESGRICIWDTVAQGPALQWNNAADVSTVWPTANKAYIYPFQVVYPTYARQLSWFNGGTASGNVDMGIYDASFAKVVSTGSTAQSGTNAFQTVNITDTLLLPGNYFMALAMDNTTGRVFGINCPTSVMAAHGCGEMATAFALPSTFTWARIATAFMPDMVISTQSVL